MITGLHPPYPRPKQEGTTYIVGGTAEWGAYLPSHPLPTLDYDELAPVQLSYVMTRCDTNKQCWEFCQIPRRRRGHTKDKVIHELGEILDNVCAANDGHAPLGVAQDFHGSHNLITMAFLGLCRKSFLKPFHGSRMQRLSPWMSSLASYTRP